MIKGGVFYFAVIALLLSIGIVFALSDISVISDSPINNYYTNIAQKEFKCNATSLNPLINATFYLWDSSNVASSQSINLNDANSSSLSFSHTFSTEGTYDWNCVFTDNESTMKSASSNYSIIYDITNPSLSVTSPTNGSYYNSLELGLALNEQGACNYSIGNLNNIMSGDATFTASVGTLENGINNVSFTCTDLAGNANSSQKVYFFIDTTSPTVSLMSPYPADATSSSASESFKYNATDNIGIRNCKLMINNTESSVDNDISTGENSFSKSMPPGVYSWHVRCTDLAGNLVNSGSRSFTITAPSSSNPNDDDEDTSESSSDSGTPRRSNQTSGITGNTVSNQEINNTSSNTLNFLRLNQNLSAINKYLLSINQNVQFSIIRENSTENHTLTLTNLTGNYTEFVLRSDPINIKLYTGEEFKTNLSSSEFYDFYLKLESINNSKAELTVKEIMEPINRNAINKTLIYALIATVCIIAIIALVFIKVKKGSKTKKNK